MNKLENTYAAIFKKNVKKHLSDALRDLNPDFACNVSEKDVDAMLQAFEEQRDHNVNTAYDNEILLCKLAKDHAEQICRDAGLEEFDVAVTETSVRHVRCFAETAIEAEQLISDRWDDGKIVLDADDFVEVEYKAEEATTET